MTVARRSLKRTTLVAWLLGGLAVASTAAVRRWRDRPVSRPLPSARLAQLGRPLVMADYRERDSAVVLGTLPSVTHAFLIIGQSQAANYGRAAAAPPGVLAVDARGVGRFSRTVAGAEGLDVSVWPRLANRFRAAGVGEILVGVAAVGGTALADWVPDGAAAELAAHALSQLRRAGHEPDAVLIMIGETDAIRRTEPVQWVAQFSRLRQHLDSLGVRAPLFVAQETRCFGVPSDSALQRAQRAVVDDQRTFAGPTLDDLDDRYRWDGCHLNDHGLDVLAGRWFDRLSELRR